MFDTEQSDSERPNLTGLDFTVRRYVMQLTNDNFYKMRGRTALRNAEDLSVWSRGIAHPTVVPAYCQTVREWTDQVLADAGTGELCCCRVGLSVLALLLAANASVIASTDLEASVDANLDAMWAEVWSGSCSSRSPS